ncbi:Nuclear poly(A) polymerase 3 [Dichanthelium oligosanthes]|uniref:polynucleotide adenylyltransferase n=1 Tax=Dichanthelium oligosanthes TaxID=888268 RepID=A0A1E5VNN8_9POAL|nr:Nuclear poly(A) polymerase 3 [Dichanthelium oligosanthes]
MSAPAMPYMAAVAAVPWWPSPAMAPVGLLAAAIPSGNPEPQTLPYLLPPPPPPPAGYPLLPPRRPIVLQLHPHPGFLAEVDRRRSCSLLLLLKDEAAVPSPEDEKRREQVIRELKKIVMRWAKAVAREQGVPQRIATATVLTYGSYTLGAHGPESDIDALCVGPCIATLQYHFFVVLRQILEGRPEVSGVQTVECAKVPLMRFRFAGIAVDFTYAQLPVIDASKASRIHCYHPMLSVFSTSLVHLGFFAGIHLAILAAYICRRYPNASVNGLFTVFFQTFAHWPWQVPDPLRHDFEWTWLFEPFPYAEKYHQFLRITLCAPTFGELRDWAGWVKSRLRFLILKLERVGIGCDPCLLEEVDHTVIEPNMVLYWGLIPEKITHVDTSSLKEDFMKDVTNDVYGKVKCTRSDVAISVVGLPQLPKSMCSHSVHWRYMQHCMLGYQATSEDQSAGWLGLG